MPDSRRLTFCEGKAGTPSQGTAFWTFHTAYLSPTTQIRRPSLETVAGAGTIRKVYPALAEHK